MLGRFFSPLFGHFRLKLLALVIALGIWFYANSRLTLEIPILAPVSTIPPADYVVLFQSAPTARLRIAGPSWLITRIESGLGGRNLRLRHELSEADLVGGWADLKIGPDWLKGNLPDTEAVQIDFRGVEPGTIRVFTSPVVQRVLPVLPRTSGEPASGFHLTGEPLAAPSQVTVRGPAVAFDFVDSIATDVIPVWDLRADLRRDCALKKDVEIELENGQRTTVELELSVPSVVVHISVSGEKEQEQTFDGVPLDVRTPIGFPYEVEFVEAADTVSVVVKGPPQELKRLRPGSVSAYVDLRSLASEKLEAGARAPYPERIVGDLPDGIQASVVRVEPPQVTLLLENPAQ